MKLAVVDYGSGNLRSAAKALERAAADAGLTAEVLVTPDPELVRRADRIVLPGVGAFGDCRRGLAALDGMIEALEESVVAAGRPFLGICVGMQLMATTGLEHGRHPGLGWVAGEVVAIDREDQGLKIPHMGWNGLNFVGARHPVLKDLSPDTHVYFVHSYMFQAEDRGVGFAGYELQHARFNLQHRHFVQPHLLEPVRCQGGSDAVVVDNDDPGIHRSGDFVRVQDQPPTGCRYGTLEGGSCSIVMGHA